MPKVTSAESQPDISDFEMKAFFTFDGAKREAINARQGDAHKLCLALHIGFLRMSGRLLGAFRTVANDGLNDVALLELITAPTT